ncbi:hypothetical protein [Halomonas koreensis]|uniref:Thioredoxin n=1 Tax=Halomonas koreensis TaxID=245385 RepID=A0ABU1G6D4_9GAMM|nr:hypothetical protein [Halomonas koreensis]MDR5868491.1 hypothetical protein [Halomonas koreensis]
MLIGPAGEERRAARLALVIRYHGQFAGSAAMLDLRDGDFLPLAGARVLPIPLFYDAAGRLVDSHVGERSRASLAPYLERLTAHP